MYFYHYKNLEVVEKLCFTRRFKTLIPKDTRLKVLRPQIGRGFFKRVLGLVVLTWIGIYSVPLNDYEVSND